MCPGCRPIAPALAQSDNGLSLAAAAGEEATSGRSSSIIRSWLGWASTDSHPATRGVYTCCFLLAASEQVLLRSRRGTTGIVVEE